MNHQNRNIVKNVIVATTIGLAALASWAFTDFNPPSLQIASAVSQLA